MRSTPVFFVLVALVGLLIGVPTVRGETSTGTVTPQGAFIGDSNFVSNISFRPTFTNPGNNIKFQTRGVLDHITPIGSSPTSDPDVYLCRAKAYYNLDLVVWTEVFYDEAVTGQTPTTLQKEWLWLATTADFYVGQWTDYHYSLAFTDYANIALNPQAAGISDAFVIKPYLQQLDAGKLGFSNTELQVAAQSFYAQPFRVSVLSTSLTDFLNYTTVVNQQTQAGGFNVQSPQAIQDTVNNQLTTAGRLCDQAAREFTEEVAGLGAVRTRQQNLTMQQGASIAPAVGATDVLENGLPLVLRPDIKRTQEQWAVTYQHVKVDTHTDGWSVATVDTTAYPREVREFTRNTGWFVQNKAMIVRMRVEFDLYALCEFTSISQPGTPTLGIPLGQLDDVVFGGEITGDTGVTAYIDVLGTLGLWLADLADWFAANWIWIVLIAVVLIGGYIFIQIGPALLMNRTPPKSNRERRFFLDDVKLKVKRWLNA